MKKLFIIVGVMLIVAMAGLALVACSGGNDGNGSDDTYYEVKGYGSSSTLNESSWIKLKNGKWSDDEGESGTYKLNGEKITIMQDGEEWMTGTLKDGTLELEIWGMPAGTYRTKAAQEKISGSSSSSGSGNGSSNNSSSSDSSSGNGSSSSSGSGSSSGGNNSGSGSSGDQSGSIDKEPEKQIITKKLSLYNLDGSITTKEIEVGKTLGTLPSPTRSNYSFQGWENLDGDVYTASSLMPSTDLELYPLWEKTVSAYSDSFLSFSPARQGYKNELAFLHGSQYGAEKYLYVEITPDDLTGSIDTSNNFSLRNLKNLNYSVSAGYTAMWYQGNFNNPNGAQRFSLGYGSNIQLITVSDSGGTVQCTYLLDIYVLRNYTVSLYKTIFDNSSYGNVTVLEGDSLPITSRPIVNGDLEFDRWVYYDGSTYRYKRFTYATEVTSNIRIYQAYKPCTAAVDLDGGTLEGNVEVEPYMDYVTLPIPTKTDYDFLGWKKADGSYFTNNRGSSQWSYYTSSTGTLTASWKKKVMYYSFADDVLTILPTEYNAVYLENGTIDSMWYTVVIGDETITVNSTNSANVGDEVTIETLTDGREGYTFLGWYEGAKKTKEGDNSKYAFIVPGQRITYTAEWTSYTIRTMREINGEGEMNNNAYAILSFDLNGGESGKPDDQMITQTEGMVYPTTIPTRSGYVFAGWYTTPMCTSLFDFTQEINGNTILYARWIPYIGAGVLPLNGTITSISAPPKTNTSSYKYYAFVPLTNGTITVFSAGNNDSYGYLYDSNKAQLVANDDGGNGSNFSISYSVTAGILYYVAPCAYGSSGISLSLAMSGATYPLAGGVATTAERKVTVGNSVTLTENELSGYTWLGWYDGETKVSEGTDLTYTFIMPTENKTLTAKWITCPIVLKKNIDEAGTVSGVSGATAIGAESTISAQTNAGYTWLGWYDGENKVSEGTNLTYTFDMPVESKSYTAKWSKVTIDRDNKLAGNVTSLIGKYNVGDEITVTATTNSGYTWVGWFDNDTKISEGANLSYTFQMPAENKTFTAVWCKLTIRNDNIAAGYVTELTDTYTAGDIVTVTANPNPGYIFIGWYDGENKLSIDGSISYTFEMPICDKVYTAEFLRCLNHTPNQNCICTKCGAEDHSTNIVKCGYCRHSNYICFGSYPQTKVTDIMIENALNVLAENNALSNNGWIPYEYMEYMDLTYNEEKYRGIRLTTQRPISADSTITERYQNYHGYNTGIIYWFKYEPIKWRVIEDENDEIFIYSETIIDSQYFYHDHMTRTVDNQTIYPNNYEYSDIRVWLNETFYNTAFSSIEKELILLTLVDNSLDSLLPSDTKNMASCTCSDTQDKVFLLSISDVAKGGINSFWNMEEGTDYAYSQGYGGRIVKSGSTNYGCWLLRSPAKQVNWYYNYEGVCYMGPLTSELDKETSGGVWVTYSCYGIVPAIKIRI